MDSEWLDASFFFVSLFLIFPLKYLSSSTFSGLVGKSTDLVHLDRDSGEMVVAGRIDHEISPWLNMSVRATDSGFPNRSSFVDIFLQIVDENDNNPYFIDSTLSNITVSEDATIGEYTNCKTRL
jgi:hypothetical protein